MFYFSSNMIKNELKRQTRPFVSRSRCYPPPPTVWAMTQESTYRNQIKCTFAKYTVKMTDTESTDKRKISENSSISETDISMEDIKLQNSKDGKQKKNL